MELLWLWTAAWTLILLVIWRSFARELLFKPRFLQAKLHRQGLRGPPRSFLAGNEMDIAKMRAAAEAQPVQQISHDIVEYVHPHIVRWSKTYGFPFYMWWSSEPTIVVNDLEIVRDVLRNKSGVFDQPAWQQKFRVDLLGKGLVTITGEEWAFRRRILTPAFHHEKIKGMVASMAACVEDMLEKWSALVKEGDPVEVEVSEYLSQVTGDVISRTAFGSSYQKGQKVFKLLQDVGRLVFQKFRSPWIKSLLPMSKLSRELRNVNRELDTTIEEIIRARIERCTNGDYGSGDLLGLMLQEIDKNNGDRDKHLIFTLQSLKEECKTFYSVGHESSARHLTWTMMLLATNSYWQDRARAEVLEVCKTVLPDAESVSKLKVVEMVVHESLRLYPPAVFFVRTAYADTSVKNLEIPEGVGIGIPVLSLSHDPEIWGEDANEFNPQRFANGVANASKYPFAFLPFSQGPRYCLGQSYALIEAKIAIAMILRKFSFEISPNYMHSPVGRVALTPKHGLPLLLRKLT